MVKKLIISLCLGFALSSIIVASNFWIKVISSHKALVLSETLPLGGDFFAFYNAGKLLKDNPDKLYNLDSQWELQKKLFIDYPLISHQPLPFLYPPLVAVPYIYLSTLSFFDAFILWAILGHIIFLTAIWILCSACSTKFTSKIVTTIIALGFSPFINLSIVSGHLSFLAILIFSLVIFALCKKANFLAGIFLSLSYYKPPLFLIFVLLLFFRRNINLVFGFILGGSILILLSMSLVGLDCFIDYLKQLPNYKYGSQVNPGIIFVPKQGAGLLSVITYFLNGQYGTARAVYFILSTFILILYITRFSRILNNSTFSKMHLALEISLSLFLSLQMVDYDLSILIVPLILVAYGLCEITETRYRYIGIFFLLLAYLAWSFNYSYIGVSENVYSASIFIVWIIFLWVCCERNRRLTAR